jgi:hypothetical protein
MAHNKTRKNDGDVEAFLSAVEDDRKRADAQQLKSLMASITDEPAAMWGGSIVGFGERHVVYKSGREVDMPEVGFSPRKQNITLYIMDGFDEYADLLERLGKHSTGKSCLYIKRIDDVEIDVLEELVRRSVAHVRGSG